MTLDPYALAELESDEFARLDYWAEIAHEHREDPEALAAEDRDNHAADAPNWTPENLADLQARIDAEDDIPF